MDAVLEILLKALTILGPGAVDKLGGLLQKPPVAGNTSTPSAPAPTWNPNKSPLQNKEEAQAPTLGNYHNRTAWGSGPSPAGMNLPNPWVPLFDAYAGQASVWPGLNARLMPPRHDARTQHQQDLMSSQFDRLLQTDDRFRAAQFPVRSQIDPYALFPSNQGPNYGPIPVIPKHRPQPFNVSPKTPDA